MPALLNLTGSGPEGLDAQLGVARVLFVPAGIDADTLNAAAVLGDIAAGVRPRAGLALVPLMRGGQEAGIIERWKGVTAAEPDERLRAEFGGLAIVFAELTGSRPVWVDGLRGWAVKQSQQVLEWQQEARVETLREMLLVTLAERFGPLPADVTDRVNAADATRLRDAVRVMVKADALADLPL